MRSAILVSLCAAGMSMPAAAADWKAVEQVKTYAVSGSTGMALYDSIGANGPTIGEGRRTIAHTTFDLKWTRKYVPSGNTCRVTVNRPSTMTIVYTLPKPKGTLDPALAARWKPFIEGITAHEKIHGQYIKEMVQRIIDTTVGFEMADDPGCTKIREAIKVPLKAASDEQRQKGRDFDRADMGEGGNVQRLIMGLVNG